MDIIIAGCSISADTTALDVSHRLNSKNKSYHSYPHFMNKLFGETSGTHQELNSVSIHNISRDAADNGTIARNLMQITTELLEKGKKPKDMYAIVQWSGIDRHSLFINKNYVSVNKFYDTQYNGWSLSSLEQDKPHWKEYFSSHTDEKALDNTLKNVKKTQEFLNKNDIKHKMICGWQIFENDLNLEKHIDISNFWFHSNEDVKYGGIIEWAKDNLEEKFHTRGNASAAGYGDYDREDKHPSNQAQHSFFNNVIFNIIGKYILKDEYIVTTGCSFTNFKTTWSDYLEEQFKDTPTTVLNVGHKGSSNDIILRGLITSVDNLLREGKKIRKVIIQLTTMERKYMINQGQFEMSPPAQNFLKSSWSSWLMPMNEGFKNSHEFWKTYWENIHSDELHFFELLEKIFMVQSYLKSKNIDYTMFCGWDLFTDSTNKNIFSKEEKYENINNELLKDKFSYCNTETHNSVFGINHYWDMIDWDNWWFFNNEKIKFGGLTEWSQYNLEKDKWYQDDLHPSFDAHKKFKDVVILDLLYGGNND